GEAKLQRVEPALAPGAAKCVPGVEEDHRLDPRLAEDGRFELEVVHPGAVAADDEPIVGADRIFAAGAADGGAQAEPVVAAHAVDPTRPVPMDERDDPAVGRLQEAQGAVDPED